MLDHRIRNGVPGRLGPSQSLHTSRLSSLHCEAIVIVSHWHKKKIGKNQKGSSPSSKWHQKVVEWWNSQDKKGTVWQMHKCTAFRLRSQQLSTQGDNCHQQRRPRHRLPEHISKRGLSRALQVVRVHSLQALNLLPCRTLGRETVEQHRSCCAAFGRKVVPLLISCWWHAGR